MIRSLLVAASVIVVACKSERAVPKAEPAPTSKPIDAPHVQIDPAAAKLPGELWFVDDGDPRRVIKLVKGVPHEIGKGADVFGALYPTSQRFPDGRVIAIASHGDGRPDGEQLVLIGDRGSIATLGPPAMQVRDPAASPDGAWVVAAVQTEGITNLMRIVTATGAATPLTTNREGNFYPIAISTEAIAFVSSRDGDSEIYRTNIDGTKTQRLTAFHREDWEPAIDVSGEQLAFTSDREQKTSRIFVVKPDGTGTRRLTAQTDNAIEESGLVWSPHTAGAYAYTQKRDRHALIVSVLGGVEKVLTPPNANDAEVAFSPDGKWLVLVRERDTANANGSNASGAGAHGAGANANGAGAHGAGANANGAGAHGAGANANGAGAHGAGANANGAGAHGAGANANGAGAHGAGANANGAHTHAHGHGRDRELVAYPLPAGSGSPIVIARGAIRTPRWF